MGRCIMCFGKEAARELWPGVHVCHGCNKTLQTAVGFLEHCGMRVYSEADLTAAFQQWQATLSPVEAPKEPETGEKSPKAPK